MADLAGGAHLSIRTVKVAGIQALAGAEPNPVHQEHLAVETHPSVAGQETLVHLEHRAAETHPSVVEQETPVHLAHPAAETHPSVVEQETPVHLAHPAAETALAAQKFLNPLILRCSVLA
jgi:hypothetical protein